MADLPEINPQASAPLFETAETTAAAAAKTGRMGKVLGGLGKVLKHPVALGGMALFDIIQLYNAISTYGQQRDAIDTLANAQPQTAQDMMRRLKLQEVLQSRTAALQYKRPDIYSNLQWLLSGQQKPSMSSREVMIGQVPDFNKIPPQAMHSALALLTDADENVNTLSAAQGEFT